MTEDRQTQKPISSPGEWAEKRISDSLDYLFGSTGTSNDLIRPVYIVVTNEVFYNGNWDEENNPLFEKWGKNWLVNVYAEFFIQAERRGLILGEDYFIVDNENGLTDKANRAFVIEELKKFKEATAEEINLRRQSEGFPPDLKAEDILIIIGSQNHVATHPDNKYLSGPATMGDLNDLASDLIEVGPLLVTETSLKTEDGEERSEFISEITSLALRNKNVIGIAFWGNFLIEEGDRYGELGLFDRSRKWSPTLEYYLLQRALYLELLKQNP